MQQFPFSYWWEVAVIASEAKQSPPVGMASCWPTQGQECTLLHAENDEAEVSLLTSAFSIVIRRSVMGQFRLLPFHKNSHTNPLSNRRPNVCGEPTSQTD